ncbi:MAG: hypothetical protein IPM39_13710 [Chloroflexi bacterium]|nr:hypothetical protein [Chloroflexota bacterium]
MITADAVVTATVTNTAVWVATDGGATTVSQRQRHGQRHQPGHQPEQDGGHNPGVCATGNAIEVEADTVVYYCYTVTNTGDEALALHDLEDDQLCTLQQPGLQPGAGSERRHGGGRVNHSATITGRRRTRPCGPPTTTRQSAHRPAPAPR